MKKGAERMRHEKGGAWEKGQGMKKRAGVKMRGGEDEVRGGRGVKREGGKDEARGRGGAVCEITPPDILHSPAPTPSPRQPGRPGRRLFITFPTTQLPASSPHLVSLTEAATKILPDSNGHKFSS